MTVISGTSVARSSLATCTTARATSSGSSIVPRSISGRSSNQGVFSVPGITQVTGGGGNREDLPITARKHPRKDRSGKQEGGAGARVLDAVPVRRSQPNDRTTDIHAGVANRDVNRAECPLRPGHTLAYLRGIGDVGRNSDGLTTQSANLSRNRFELIGGARGEGQASTFPSKRKREGAAEPPAATGDEDDPPAEIAHTRRLLPAAGYIGVCRTANGWTETSFATGLRRCAPPPG
jgi:hypothetical protein